jgi:hypothetical protein
VLTTTKSREELEILCVGGTLKQRSKAFLGKEGVHKESDNWNEEQHTCMQKKT